MMILRRFGNWLRSLRDSPPDPTVAELQAAMATALEDFLAIMPTTVKPDCFMVGPYWQEAASKISRWFMGYFVRFDDTIKDQTIYLKGRRA